jgi:hypothetical protein
LSLDPPVHSDMQIKNLTPLSWSGGHFSFRPCGMSCKIHCFRPSAWPSCFFFRGVISPHNGELAGVHRRHSSWGESDSKKQKHN